MFRISVLALTLVFFAGLSGCVYAQGSGDRTSEIVAALDKTKYKKKEKKGIKVEVYVDIRNEAALKRNAADYSGVYRDPNFGCRLELKVSADGTAEGSGYEGDDSHGQNYTLTGARVNGALLTATKVLANGETRKFEAVFVNRISKSGTNPNSIDTTVNSYGLGYVESGQGWSSRVFLEFQK